MANQTELLSAADIEEHYGIQKHRFYDLARAGAFPSLRIGERRVFVRREAWENYLKTVESK